MKEAPLCHCGKPRKLAKTYVNVTGSMYYKTCGNPECRKGKRSRIPLRVGKKPVLKRFSIPNDPTKICKREGCFNPVGSGKVSTGQRVFCSKKCAIENRRKDFTSIINKNIVVNAHKREFLSQIYADLKAGAKNSEIKRMYHLSKDSLRQVLKQVVSNREREIVDKLHKVKEN